LNDAPWLEKKIDELREYYVSILRFILQHSFWRKVTILAPIGLVFLTLILLAPSI
jgi:hypothetical protein